MQDTNANKEAASSNSAEEVRAGADVGNDEIEDNDKYECISLANVLSGWIIKCSLTVKLLDCFYDFKRLKCTNATEAEVGDPNKLKLLMAKCKHCDETQPHKHFVKGNNSNLKTHLMRVHKAIYQDLLADANEEDRLKQKRVHGNKDVPRKDIDYHQMGFIFGETSVNDCNVVYDSFDVENMESVSFEFSLPLLFVFQVFFFLESTKYKKRAK